MPNDNPFMRGTNDSKPTTPAAAGTRLLNALADLVEIVTPIIKEELEKEARR